MQSLQHSSKLKHEPDSHVPTQHQNGASMQIGYYKKKNKAEWEF